MARSALKGLWRGPDWIRHRSLTCVNTVERVTRIELALSAWEADVLPLNYTRTRPSVQLWLGNVFLTRRPVWI